MRDATGWSLMPYGWIACFTTKPGHRDAVVAQLTTAGRALGAFGCCQYIVGAACADEVTVSVSEVWESQQSHDDSLRHDATRQSISQTLPLLAGEFAHHEVSVA